mmetsp:Transcript_61203/g.97379  ORF Transcript_61203/g.97379 Transcript_61203/m.97379 type:complete len:252 (-) Transcript_61203:32-787(-)
MKSTAILSPFHDIHATNDDRDSTRTKHKHKSGNPYIAQFLCANIQRQRPKEISIEISDSSHKLENRDIGRSICTRSTTPKSARKHEHQDTADEQQHHENIPKDVKHGNSRSFLLFLCANIHDDHVSDSDDDYSRTKRVVRFGLDIIDKRCCIEIIQIDDSHRILNAGRPLLVEVDRTDVHNEPSSQRELYVLFHRADGCRDGNRVVWINDIGIERDGACGGQTDIVCDHHIHAVLPDRVQDVFVGSAEIEI